jgi:hypothetical protein
MLVARVKSPENGDYPGTACGSKSIGKVVNHFRGTSATMNDDFHRHADDGSEAVARWSSRLLPLVVRVDENQ